MRRIGKTYVYVLLLKIHAFNTILKIRDHTIFLHTPKLGIKIYIYYISLLKSAFVAQMVNNLPAMQET